MKASEFFAKKAQESTDSMETITVQMHQIAIKTEQETVSMRIITLVTLFFLPGTFVAVLHSSYLPNGIHTNTWTDIYEHRYPSIYRGTKGI